MPRLPARQPLRIIAESSNSNGVQMITAQEAQLRAKSSHSAGSGNGNGNGSGSGNGNGIAPAGMIPIGRMLAKNSSNGNGSASTVVQAEVMTETSSPSRSPPSLGSFGNSNGSGSARGGGFAMPISMTVADSGVNDIPLDTGFDWADASYSKGKRTATIWTFVLRLRASLFLLDQKWSYLGGFTDEKRSKRARGIAVWVRETILQLGPTFIKLGQLFSTRADILAPEFVEELSKLQDRVPAFSKVRSILTQELGAPPEQIFATFDERPLAAASLGQVHRATLRSGEEVVVKVQRPGLKQLFDIDLEVRGKCIRFQRGLSSNEILLRVFWSSFLQSMISVPLSLTIVVLLLFTKNI